MYNLFVYRNGIRIGIVQNIRSLQWLDKYQDVGEIKLVVSATAENISLLVEGNRLYNTDQTTVAIIRETDISDNSKDPTITIRGLLSASLLNERVVIATQQITNAESGMRNIYSKNRRGLPAELGSFNHYTETLNTQITWDSVLDAEKVLASSSGLGFRVVFNPETAAETFEVYKGIDRTKEGSTDYNGYFGDDIGNISKIEIKIDSSEYKNVAVVAGQGQGADRVVLIVGSGTGESRKELYVDASDISTTYQVAADTGKVDDNGNPIYDYTDKAYTTDEYSAMLTARGLEKLAEKAQISEISAEVQESVLRYGIDYFLGDIIPLKITKYGIKISARVDSVTIVYEADGKKVTPSLSNFQIISEVQNS